MKILICGKGGSGKSTVSVLIAKGLKNMGYSVLIVDADESNFGLYRLLGISESESLIEKLGGKKGAKNRMVAFFSKQSPPSPFMTPWKINELPEDCMVNVKGLRLLVIGKIHRFGEGCACSMGFVAKTFLSNLDVGNDEMVIVDTEAGIEHFGRGVEQGCDMIIGLIDPTYESFMLAQKIEEMARNSGKDVFFLLNKTEDAVEGVMDRYADKEKVIARLPKDNAIFMDSLEGKELSVELPEIDQVCRFIEGRGKR